MPRDVFLAEARRVADLIEAHAEALSVARVRPEEAEELRTLCALVDEVTPLAQTLSTPESKARAEARLAAPKLISRMRASLDVVARRVAEETILSDQMRVHRKHFARSSRDRLMLIAQLEDLLVISRPHLDARGGLPGIPASDRAECVQCVRALEVPEAPPLEIDDARWFRKRTLWAIDGRVKELRAVARLVFRTDEATAELFRSRWQARKRAERRGRKKAAASQG